MRKGLKRQSRILDRVLLGCVSYVFKSKNSQLKVENKNLQIGWCCDDRICFVVVLIERYCQKKYLQIILFLCLCMCLKNITICTCMLLAFFSASLAVRLWWGSACLLIDCVTVFAVLFCVCICLMPSFFLFLYCLSISSGSLGEVVALRLGYFILGSACLFFFFF